MFKNKKAAQIEAAFLNSVLDDASQPDNGGYHLVS